MPSEHFLFIGFEIDDDVSARLSECAERDQIYIDNPDFLQQFKIDAKSYIGKRAENGMTIDRMDDMARSVVSLLSRVSPGWPFEASDAMIFPVEASNREAASDAAGESQEFEYSELIG